jgi:hypothetical protein
MSQQTASLQRAAPHVRPLEELAGGVSRPTASVRHVAHRAALGDRASANAELGSSTASHRPPQHQWCPLLHLPQGSRKRTCFAWKRTRVQQSWRSSGSHHQSVCKKSRMMHYRTEWQPSEQSSWGSNNRNHHGGRRGSSRPRAVMVHVVFTVYSMRSGSTDCSLEAAVMPRKRLMR